ncbi:MAG: hypothetical protein KGK30_06085 [Elusimicrobia bacterium]|nr:hypothetical protein [Elusimicrobiota bacterium]
MRLLKAIYNNLVAQVREVTRRYAAPRIHMTPLVKVCLFGLRIYLFTLVGLMLFKFVTLVK